jgi:Ca2+-binding EF-hand superfamily protein
MHNTQAETNTPPPRPYPLAIFFFVTHERSLAFSFSLCLDGRELDHRWNARAGEIGRNELLAMMRAVKPETTEESVAALFSGIDTNKSQALSATEFAGFYKKAFADAKEDDFHKRIATTSKYLTRKPALAAVFAKFDADKSGSLDAAEMAAMIKLSKPNTDEKQITALMSKLDLNQDSSISSDEFVSYFFHTFASDTDVEFADRLEQTFEGLLRCRFCRRRRHRVVYNVNTCLTQRGASSQINSPQHKQQQHTHTHTHTHTQIIFHVAGRRAIKLKTVRL